MKKTMVLAVSALVLILAGCPQPGNDNNGGDGDDIVDFTPILPVSVTVGGISAHDGGFGAIGLRNAQGALVAASNPVGISGGSVAMALLNVQNGTPFNTEGPFTLELVVSETESGDAVWFGDIASRPVVGGNNDIPFGYFTPWAEDAPVVDGTEYRIPPGDEPENQLDWLRRNARSRSRYLIEITVGAGETPFAPQVLDTFGRSDVTVVIRGDGAPTIALSQRGHLFSIGSGVTLILENVILQGRADNHLSLVGVWGGTLIMEEGSKVTGNTRSGSGAGVIVGGGGTLIMNGGEIYRNHSSYAGWVGGAGVTVWSGGTFRMYGGVISHNIATRLHNEGNSVETVGGGVRTYGTFVMDGGRISNNTAQRGAGVLVNAGTFTMLDGEISGNTGPNNNRWSSGGGVAIVNGAFVMYDGRILDNNIYHGSGGGVQVGTWGNYNATFIMRNGEISGNTVDRYGGGLAVNGNGVFTMYNGTVIDNTAPYGGGVAANGTFTMHNGTISDNTAHRGAGVSVRGEFTLIDGTITRNTAEGGYWNIGGGVYVQAGDGSGGIFRMYGGEISYNTVDGGGGGVIVAGGGYWHNDPVDGIFNMIYGTITSNTAHGGGGVSVDGTFDMSGGIISGNVAYYDGWWNAGGGVRVNFGDGSGGIFRMRGGKIYGNSVNGYGGGVAVLWGSDYHSNPVGGTFLISDGRIYGNNATGNLENTAYYWAALYVGGGDYPATAQRGTFNNGTFTPATNGDLTSADNTVHVVGGDLR